MNKWFLKNINWIFICVILIALDLFTKYLAKTYILNPIKLVPKFLYLSFNMNPGIAFSIPLPNVVMIIVTPILICVAIWFIVKYYNLDLLMAKISLILILAGSLGNFLNRIWTGAVIDMISVSFWPIFNLADTYLTVGAFILIVFYGKIQRNDARGN